MRWHTFFETAASLFRAEPRTKSPDGLTELVERGVLVYNISTSNRIDSRGDASNTPRPDTRKDWFLMQSKHTTTQDTPLKRCPHCGQLQPATTLYFYRGRKTPDGFQTPCIACKQAQRKALQQRIRYAQDHESVGEEWRDIPGYVGLYQVSDQGHVRSTRISRYGRSVTWQLLKCHINRNGYIDVGLTNDGRLRMFRVHRLVLLAFVGETPEGTEGSHLDGNRRNNCLNNLVWETSYENNHRKILHGTEIHQAGEEHWAAKLTENDVLNIRKLCADGMMQTEIAKRYGVHKTTISDIFRRKSWSHIP